MSDILAAVVRTLTPRVRERPSEWVRKNVRLASEQTNRPGPVDPDIFPWMPALLDTQHDYPTKRGEVVIKPSQVGYTTVTLLLMLYNSTRNPGPTLYVTSTEEKRDRFAHNHFKPMLESCADAKALLAEAIEAGRRKISTSFPFPGGGVDFATAGTQSSLTSDARKFVHLDEYTESCDNFPSASGDMHSVALGRLERFKTTGFIRIGSHPRFPNLDVHAIYENMSTRTVWSFDCPHCGGVIQPWWTNVQFKGIDMGSIMEREASRIDPDAAVFVCEHCTKEVSDSARARATWHDRKGGSGRFAPKAGDELTEIESARREYVGRWIHRLADPTVTVRELVTKFRTFTSHEERQGFYNMGLGQTYAPVAGVVTVDRVKEICKQPLPILPGGVDGVRFLTCGVDVQWPPENPTFYLDVRAWCGNGHAFVISLRKLLGFAALGEFLREFSAKVQGEDAVQTLGIKACGMDRQGQFSSPVHDFCRSTGIISRATGAHVRMVPLAYAPHVKADLPFIVPADRKRLDPARPWLGLIEKYDLNRDHFVARAMHRIQAGTVSVVCEVPEDYAAHLTANAQVPVRTLHGWESGELVWELQAKRRDDWFQAGAYAEAVAVTSCGLLNIHEQTLGTPTQAAVRTASPYANRLSYWRDKARRK